MLVNIGIPQGNGRVKTPHRRLRWLNARLCIPVQKRHHLIANEMNGSRKMNTTSQILRPMPVAITALVLLTALGWGVMFAEAVTMASGAAAFMEALCAPRRYSRFPLDGGNALGGWDMAIGMWIAMSVGN